MTPDASAPPRPKPAAHTALWEPDRIEDAVSEAARLGFRAIEGGDALFKRFNGKTELLQELLRPHSMRLLAVPHAGRAAMPGEREAIIREAMPRLAFLKTLGARYLIFTAGSRETVRGKREDIAAAADLAGELGKRCLDHDLYLCVHPAVDTRVMDEEDIDRLMNAVDTSEVFLCLDTGHLFRAEQSPADILETFGECVKHIHFRDAYPPGEEERDGQPFCAPGEGAVDFKPFIAALRKMAYNGWITLEPADGEGDPAETMESPRNRARDWIREEWEKSDA